MRNKQVCVFQFSSATKRKRHTQFESADARVEQPSPEVCSQSPYVKVASKNGTTQACARSPSLVPVWERPFYVELSRELRASPDWQAAPDGNLIDVLWELRRRQIEPSKATK